MMCGSGAPGTICPGAEEDEAESSAAFFLKRKKALGEEAFLSPPAFKGAPPSAAEAPVAPVEREVKGKKDTMVLCGAEEEKKKKAKVGKRNKERAKEKTVKPRRCKHTNQKKKGKIVDSRILPPFNARSLSFHSRALCTPRPLAHAQSPSHTSSSLH